MKPDKRPPDEPEGLHAEALSFLRPSQTRAERVISDLLYDSNTPENIRESISKSFELTEAELLRLARQGVEAAVQFLGAVLEDRAQGPDKRLAETRETLRTLLAKDGLSPSTGTPAANASRKVPIPGSPAWKAREAARARGVTERKPGPTKPETTPPQAPVRPEGYLGGIPLKAPNPDAATPPGPALSAETAKRLEADGVINTLDPNAEAPKSETPPKPDDKSKKK
jgi:hypothetical protein